MEVTSLRAKPIEQEGKDLILLFGPDAILKTAAAYLRTQYRGHTVNIRSTDNPLDSYAEGTPCEMRVLIHSGFSDQIAEMYRRAGLPMRVMRWDGEKLIDMDGFEAPAKEQPSALPPQLRLENGTYVDRNLALENAARHMGMTLAAVMALDEQTILSMVELAYNQPKTPERVVVQSPARKKKGKG